MIEVQELEVRFGGVKPLDGMTVAFPAGTCGLIGPNGAGKTTFFNVLSGFVKPAGGSVTAFDEDLLAMADYRRARWGLRRTFQTEQAIEELSLYDNVAMVEEHSSRRTSAVATAVLTRPPRFRGRRASRSRRGAPSRSGPTRSACRSRAPP